MKTHSSLVRASGGLVLRPSAGGEAQVLVIYRAKRADWTFPKGKVEPDETDEACALREVEEETGLHCALGDELGSTRYVDRKGRDKVVRYWLMWPIGGEAAPRHEVDAVRWVTLAEAARILTHTRDVVLLDALAAARRG